MGYTAPKRSTIASSYSKRYARAVWLSTLYTEYLAMHPVREYGAPVQITAREETPKKEKHGDTLFSVYTPKLNLDKFRRSMKEPDMASLYTIAGEELKRKGYEVEEGRLKTVVVEEHEVKAPEDALEEADKATEKIAEIFSRLDNGDNILARIIVDGYTDDTVIQAEGLSEDEKRFIIELLDKPFVRAALLIGFRRLYPDKYRMLLHIIMHTVFMRNKTTRMMNPNMQLDISMYYGYVDEKDGEEGEEDNGYDEYSWD